MEKIFSVSEFNEFVDIYVQQMNEIVIEGEISEFKISQGKWIFITIKDKSSSVGVFGMTFKLSGYSVLEEGMKVHVYGIPGIYQKKGEFRVNATKIVPAGEGALKLAFEKLKSKLEKEGLFDISRKRELPKFPQRIGLVTAKGSQAYNDFVKVLSARMGGIQICFYPVNVQGRDSVQTILDAFDYFNSTADCDVVVLCRGGGSLEDLISFNDESIARAVFSSRIPVVTGVGHEGDITLVDLVADLRASTPSNAAELIVQNKAHVFKEVHHMISFMESKLNYQLQFYENKVNGALGKIERVLHSQVNMIHSKISYFLSFLYSFEKDINSQISKSEMHIESMYRNYLKKVEKTEEKTDSLLRLIKSLDYRKVLSRGFSLTCDENGKVIKSIKELEKGQKINSSFIDGSVDSSILNIKYD